MGGRSRRLTWPILRAGQLAPSRRLSSCRPGPARRDPGEFRDGRAGKHVHHPGCGREPRSVAREPYSQCARTGHENQGRIHRQCLTVDTDPHRGARAELESRCAPLDPPGESADLARRLERGELPGISRVGDHDRHDPEHTLVDPRAGSPAAGMVELIRVVRHEDQVCGRVRPAVRSGVAQVELGRVRPSRSGRIKEAVFSFASR